jgi:hypothetical protein
MQTTRIPSSLFDRFWSRSQPDMGMVWQPGVSCKRRLLNLTDRLPESRHASWMYLGIHRERLHALQKPSDHGLHLFFGLFRQFGMLLLRH